MSYLGLPLVTEKEEAEIEAQHTRAAESIMRDELREDQKRAAKLQSERTVARAAAVERQRRIDISDHVKSFGDPTTFMLTAVMDALQHVKCSHPEFQSALTRIRGIRAAYAAQDAEVAVAKKHSDRVARHWKNLSSGTPNADGSYCALQYEECSACQRADQQQ